MHNRSKSGFTIVELLIVIVVIAILATITIVAFNGIQQRAINSQTVSAVNAYKKAIFQYAIDNNGSAPYGTRSNICLGSGYTSTIGATNNVCATGGIAGGQTIPDDDATFTANISKYLQTEPVTGGQLIDNGSGSQAIGIVFWSSGREIYYFLRGAGQSCTAGGTASSWSSAATMCTLALTLPS